MCQLRLPQLSEIIEKEPDRFKDIQGNILVKIKQNGDSQLNDLCLDGDALRFIKPMSGTAMCDSYTMY